MKLDYRCPNPKCTEDDCSMNTLEGHIGAATGIFLAEVRKQIEAGALPAPASDIYLEALSVIGVLSLPVWLLGDERAAATPIFAPQDAVDCLFEFAQRLAAELSVQRPRYSYRLAMGVLRLTPMVNSVCSAVRSRIDHRSIAWALLLACDPCSEVCPPAVVTAIHKIQARARAYWVVNRGAAGAAVN